MQDVCIVNLPDVHKRMKAAVVHKHCSRALPDLDILGGEYTSQGVSEPRIVGERGEDSERQRIA